MNVQDHLAKQRALLANLDAWEKSSSTGEYEKAAQANMIRWQQELQEQQNDGMPMTHNDTSIEQPSVHRPEGEKTIIRVEKQDCLIAAQQSTQEFAEIHAVLTIANHQPGGCYMEGNAAPRPPNTKRAT